MKHINLPTSEPRCRNRSRHCENASRCARNLAPMPARGASIGDFSTSLARHGLELWCPQFKPVEYGAAKAVEPGVKPAIGGLA